MTPRKLARTLEELQQLFAVQAARDPRFKAAARSIADIAQALQIEKPTLQIISSNLEVAQAFQHWLGSCVIEFGSITISRSERDAIQPVSTIAPTLVLQESQPVRYQPSYQPAVIIGRCPDSDVLIPDHYGLVSGHHAKLLPLHSSNPAEAEWHLLDCSRNGTYVNAQPVQERCVLREGDRITLGLPYPTEICPEVIFERPVAGQAQQEWNDGTSDVVCLITSAEALDRATIDRLQAPLTNAVVIVDAASSDILVHDIKQHLSAQLDSSPIEIFVLPCEAFQQNSAAPLDVQKEFNRLGKHLKALTGSEAKKRLMQRLIVRTLHCLTWADEILTAQEQALGAIAQQVVQGTTVAAPRSKEELNKIWKQLSEEAKSTFTVFKESLKQSKADLVDDYLENSLSNKIRAFVQNLRLCIFSQDGQKFIQLKLFINGAIVNSVSEEVQEVQLSDRARTAKSPRVLRKRIFKRKQVKLNVIQSVTKERAVDANTALLNFCRFELSSWIDAEWERIWSSYAQGGLKRLQEKIYAIDAISDLDRQSHPAMLPSEQELDYESIFDEAFAKAACESRYQEPPAVIYLLKKIRSQWMQFIFLFSLLSVLGIASRRQIMQHITAPIMGAFQRSPWISTIVLLFVLFYVSKLLITLYRQDRDAEREKEAKKLRDGLCSYYQSLVKNRLLEKLHQCLNVALDAEEKKVQAAIDLLKQEPVVVEKNNLFSFSSYIKKSQNLYKDIQINRVKLQDLGKTLL